MTAKRVLARVVLAAVLLATAAESVGHAATPTVTMRASATRVELGESFNVSFKISGDDGSFTRPELRPPAGLRVIGQSMTEFSQRVGGTRQAGFEITWSIVGIQIGHFVIPAPVSTWNGSPLKTQAMAIDVVASSGRPRASANNPFLMPGGPSFRFSFPGQDDLPADDPAERDSAELALPSAPDERVFLRAVVDKKRAVIGEQITLSFYQYSRVEIRDPGMVERHEAPLSDFRRFPLVANPGADPTQTAKAGAARYNVKLIDRLAIFPLGKGDLHTGSLRIRYVGAGMVGERATEDLVITVTEPPREHRPPGYAIGDVGQFTMSATVEPRRLEQGGTAAVTLKVEGTGTFPQSLRVPARTGVSWLDPEKKDGIASQAGIVGGWRTFGYVVRVNEKGTVALGAVELPHWNPAKKRYDVARVELGGLEVTPAPPPIGPLVSAPGQPDEPAADPFRALPPPRMALGSHATARSPVWGESNIFWMLIAAPPLLVGLSFGGAGASRRLRARRASGAASPATLSARALRDAAEAETRGDVKELAGAIERAIHLAIEAGTGVKSRGVLLSELPSELAHVGVAVALGDEIRATLAACETIRFDPSGADAQNLVARAQRVAADLGRTRTS